MSSEKRKRRRYAPAWDLPGHAPAVDPARASYWTKRIRHATDVRALNVLRELLRATLPDLASRQALEEALDRRREQLGGKE